MHRIVRAAYTEDSDAPNLLCICLLSPSLIKKTIGQRFTRKKITAAVIKTKTTTKMIDAMGRESKRKSAREGGGERRPEKTIKDIVDDIADKLSQ